MAMPKPDWSRLDAMTDEQVHAAALSDPDAQPWTNQELAHVMLLSRAAVIRHALGMSHEEFAPRYRIPLAMLDDWDTGRSVPDAAATAYHTVIDREPEMVGRALHSASGRAA